MTTVILTRHGHVEGIDPPRFRGQQQLSLTDQGRQEALSVAQRISNLWKPIEVRTSPLERCVVTGAKIAGACDLQPSSDIGLLDIHYGEWQGKSYDEVRESWPHLYELWRKSPHLVQFPSGESLQDIVLRSAGVFRRTVQAFPDGVVVLVGHDSVNRALLLQVLDQPLSAYWKIAQDPCCINVIEYKDGLIHVRSINDVQHIKISAVRVESESVSS